MYDSWESLVEGFSKNLIRIFGGSKRFFIPMMISLNLILTFSIWAWPFKGLLAAVCAALVLGTHFFSLLLMERSLGELPGRIAGLWDLNLLAVHAFISDLTGTAVWKGRVINRQKEPHGNV